MKRLCYAEPFIVGLKNQVSEVCENFYVKFLVFGQEDMEFVNQE